MTPFLAENDHTYHRLIDAVICRDYPLFFTLRVALANLNDVELGEFTAAPVQLPAHLIMPPSSFGHAICLVRFGSANEYMVGVEARRIVAMMAGVLIALVKIKGMNQVSYKAMHWEASLCGALQTDVIDSTVSSGIAISGP